MLRLQPLTNLGGVDPLIIKMTNGVISMQRTVDMGLHVSPRFCGISALGIDVTDGKICLLFVDGSPEAIYRYRQCCCRCGEFEYEMEIFPTYTYIYRRRVFPESTI